MYCLITGTPHHHPSHPDYVPSVFSFTRRKEKQDSRKGRFERRMERIVKVQEQEEEVRQQNKRAEEKEKEEREQREEEECILNAKEKRKNNFKKSKLQPRSATKR